MVGYSYPCERVHSCPRAAQVGGYAHSSRRNDRRGFSNSRSRSSLARVIETAQSTIPLYLACRTNPEGMIARFEIPNGISTRKSRSRTKQGFEYSPRYISSRMTRLTAWRYVSIKLSGFSSWLNENTGCWSTRVLLAAIPICKRLPVPSLRT